MLLAAAVVLAFLLIVTARYSGEPVPVAFFIPIILGAWFGDLWIGLGCTLLTVLCALYASLTASNQVPWFRGVDLFRFGSLIAGGILISMAGERLHRARRNLARRDQHFRLMGENIPDVFWIFDLDARRMLYVSPSVERLLGFEAGAIGQPLIGPGGSRIEERFDAFLAGGASTHVDECRQTRKDGSQVWTETLTRMVRNRGTGHIEIYGATRDIDARKRAQEELIEVRDRYRSLFKNMEEGYVHCRMIFENGRPVDFEYLAANDAFTRLTGLRDVAGKRASQLLPNLHSADSGVLERHGRVALTGVPERFELYVQSLDQWFAASVYCPSPGEFISVFDNITGRRRAQEALRINEAHLRLAFRAANAGAWEWTPATGGNYWHEEMWSLLGLEPHSCEPSYEAWLSAVHPDDRQAVDDAVRGAAARGEDLSTEWRVNRADGTQRWLMTRGQPVFTADGRLDRYIGAVFDITDRKLIEKSLRESEELFRILVEQASDAIYLHDHEGRLSVINKQAGESLGYNQDELRSMSVTDIETDFDLAAAQAEWSRVRAGETYTLYGHHRRKDGTLFPAEVRLSLCEIHGRRYYLGLARDITERRRAEEALQDLNASLEQRVALRTRELLAANRELESFSYSVSHDLRAPLRAIDGFARALMEDYGRQLDARGLDYLNRITAASERMFQLIEDLLGLSRISRSELARQPVDASAIVRIITEQLVLSQPARAVEFDIEDGVLLYADHRMLRVMLENLLENAFKFTLHKPDARICFGSCQGSGGPKVCFVRDNGAGFDMQYAEKLFGAFQRLHSNREFPGSGIGLATVQRIINRHGGRVWAEGQPNEGATFYFTIDEQVASEDLHDVPPRDSND